MSIDMYAHRRKQLASLSIC